MKYAIKKKATNNRLNLVETGGGPAMEKKLTDFEKRVVAILGKSFTDGAGISECGVRSQLNSPSVKPSHSSAKDILLSPSSLMPPSTAVSTHFQGNMVIL